MSEREKREIEAMKEEIRRRGGLVHVSETLPVELQKMFLQEVLACPDCGGKEDGH